MDIVQLYMNSAFTTGTQAYEALMKLKNNCDGASESNVMRVKLNSFERFFVFSGHGESSDGGGGEKVGRVMRTIRLVVKMVGQQDRALHGQVADVRSLRKPEGCKLSSEDEELKTTVTTRNTEAK